MTRLPAPLIDAVLCTAFARAHADERYTGMCDASAAVSIGHGRFIVADDEIDVLRVYQKSASAPVASLDLIDYLHNRKGTHKNHEGDLEGAAAIGDRIYWISSHARKGKDKSVDPHRMRFFTTRITAANPANGAGVAPVADAPYETLLADLMADPRFAILAEASKYGPENGNPDGLNIEGLAATPEAALLIGFRNPQPGNKALVVSLLNPREVIARSARPKFGNLIRLDLNGRGIRSFERVNDEYLIVAGPRGEADKAAVKPAFALFRWSGAADKAPVLVHALDDGSFRPEALFYDSDSKELVMLSDDGGEKVGTLDCKDTDLPANKKSFRVKRLAWSAR